MAMSEIPDITEMPEELRSSADRQKDYRDRKKEAEREDIRNALDGAPDHILAVATGDFDEGYESRCLVEAKAYSSSMLYVQQSGLFIRDEDGFYNQIASQEGMRALARLMDEQRRAFQEYLTAHLSNDQWKTTRFDVARRKLSYPSHRCIQEVCRTLESVSSLPTSEVEECEFHDMNRYRLMMLDNGVIDVNMEPIRLLSFDEIAERKAIRPEVKGRASYKKDAHLENNKHVDMLGEIILTHDRPLRYLWHLMVTGGEKEAGYIKAVETNAGKSTMLALMQEATGQLSIADRKIMISGSRFNHLEGMMTKCLLVAIDEADKLDQLSPHLINSAINSGRVHIEEKYATPIIGRRKANLALVAGGDVSLDWHAQGITPDKDGEGGRFRSMVTMSGKMETGLGKFLNSDISADERQGTLTALVAYLADKAYRWSEVDAKIALMDLMDMAGKSYEDWQIALVEQYMRGLPDQWITSKDIKATIDTAAGKAPSDKAVKQFIEQEFGVTKDRLPPSKGRGMAWIGLTMAQDNSIEMDFEGDK